MAAVICALDGHRLRWIWLGHYHSIIGGDGRVHQLHAYSVDLPAHLQPPPQQRGPLLRLNGRHPRPLDPASYFRAAQQPLRRGRERP